MTMRCCFGRSFIKLHIDNYRYVTYNVAKIVR